MTNLWIRIRKKNRGEARKLFETPKTLEKSKLKG
jgi:hypothetical protein